MKMKKKALTLCLAVALAATAVVGGTMAYFTDTDNVENTMTFGNVDISLDEAKVVKEGDAFVEQDERVKSNTYESVYPGVDLPKDPTVHNEGSESAYVRALVTVSLNTLGAYKNENATGPEACLNEMIDVQEGWNFVGQYDSSYDPNEGYMMTYEFRYNKPLEGGKSTAPLFTHVTIPAEWTNETISTYIGKNFGLDVTAHAIQTAGFTDAAEAWAAFDGE